MDGENDVLQSEKPCSVKFAVNAKGFWSGEVKSYRTTTLAAYNEALSTAMTLEKVLKNKNGENKDGIE